MSRITEGGRESDGCTSDQEGWSWEDKALGLWSLKDPNGGKAGLVVGKTYRLCDSHGKWLGPAVEVNHGAFLAMNKRARDMCLAAAIVLWRERRMTP